MDRNGCVDTKDLTIVAGCIGQTVNPCNQSALADLNGDGVVIELPE